jgi:hypothetical protein
MTFVINDKTLRMILIIVAIVTVIILIVFRFRSAYKFPTTTPTANADNATAAQLAYSNLQTCYDTFLGTDTTVQANIDTKNSCYQSNVTTYINALCPEVNNTTRAANTSYKTAYDTDLSEIKRAYQGFIQTPTTVNSAVTTTSPITEARRADTIWATRKYIASSCPGFYVASSAAGDTDPGTSYKNWQRGNAALGSDANAKYWQSSRITGANIWNWMQYAGNAPTDASGNTSDSTAVLGGTGLAACTSAAGTNCSKAFFTNNSGVANWKIARENGPGTMPTVTWGTNYVAAPV